MIGTCWMETVPGFHALSHTGMQMPDAWWVLEAGGIDNLERVYAFVKNDCGF